MGKVKTPASGGPHHPPGHWGKHRGKTCAFPNCKSGAKARGYCTSHYNKTRWAEGHRPPSVNPVSRRVARLKFRYGIKVEDYDRLFAEQGGRCAICRKPPTVDGTPNGRGKLFIDHDHDTGEVRGLLCNDCNLTIGHGKTEVNLLRAAQYLSDREGRHT
ncbi:MAG: endonuclease VII domain-containing protein [Fimbriiglobus sp.]